MAAVIFIACDQFVVLAAPFGNQVTKAVILKMTIGIKCQSVARCAVLLDIADRVTSAIPTEAFVRVGVVLFLCLSGGLKLR